ncbi:regulator of chromosome condensation 1/beta-lactamase-inhibitor protein II [Daedaleopsis nitida]|nr:regulator of chromosome condensation 1/beta-lactamase-inhibitor protein II [Daedaleopsis nitida]
MALATTDANVACRNRTTSKRQRSSSPAKAQKRPTTRKGKTTVAERAKPSRPTPAQLNSLPAPPPHERPSWRLFCWGVGDSGQLGMGESCLSATLVKPRRNQHVEKLGHDGTLGPPGAGLEAIAAGSLHSAFIDEKGTVWTCGPNDNAELGRTTVEVTQGGTTVEVDKETSIPFHLPAPIQSLVEEGFRAVTVTLGDCIGVVLDTDGQMRAWGTYRTSNGHLGFSPSIPKQYLPIAIPVLTGLRFSSTVAGDNHVLLLTVGGEIYSAGSSEYLQLGRRVLKRRLVTGTVPERVILQSRSRKAVVIGAGADHSFAVDEDGTVWGWGLNGHGQTGTGVDPNSEPEDRVVQAPLPVPGLGKADLGGSTVTQIAGGAQHTLFLTADGRVFACGNCEDGQLGIPDQKSSLTEEYPLGFVPEPVLVPFPDHDDPVIAVACGTHNSLAVTKGGAMYAWGRDTLGQLGTGEEGVDVRTPTVIVRKDGGSWSAKAASCGCQHSLALLRQKNSA